MIPTSYHQRVIAPKLNMVVIGVAYLIFAVSMWFSPGRWIHASAYDELAQLVPIHTWSLLFLISGVMLIISPLLYKIRTFIVTSLTFSLMLSFSWTVASLLRYLADDAVRTTPVAWVSWLLIGYIIIRAAFTLDQPDKLQVLVKRDEGSRGGDKRD